MKNVPFFRKDIKFTVVKSEEKAKEEAKASSEPKTEPTPEQTEAKKEPLDAAELEKLRGQWRGALEEAWATRLNPDVKMFIVKGAHRLFYCVSAGNFFASSQQFLALDEELLPVRLNVQCSVTIMGPIVKVEVEPLKPAPVGLSPDKAAAIAERLIKEFGKGGETEK